MGKVHAVDLVSAYQAELSEARQKHENLPRGKKTEQGRIVSDLKAKLERAQKKKDEVKGLIHERSIIVHAGNWRKLFSSIFIFLSRREWDSKEDLLDFVENEK
jgi:hypothetical protein